MKHQSLLLFTIYMLLLYHGAIGQDSIGLQQDWAWRYTISNSEPIELKQQSLFYWNRKITDASHLENHLIADTISLYTNHASWLNNTGIDPSIEALGMGTFHVQILLPDTSTDYALYIRGVLAAYEVWADAKYLGGAGKVGLDEANTQHDFQSKIIKLPRQRKVDLFINVANYYHWRGGGITEPIRLGGLEELQKKRLHNVLIDGILIFILIFIGIYHLILFAFYPKNRAYLYFALFALTSITREVCLRDVLLKILWEDAPYQLIQQFRYIGFYLGSGCLSMYAKHIFDRLYYPIIHKVIFLIAAVASVLTLILPLSWSPYISPIYQLTIPFGSLYLMYVVSKNIKWNTLETALLLIGGGCALIALVHDILLTQGFIIGPYVFVYGFVALVFSHTLILANRHKTIYLKAKMLTDELAYLNQNLEGQVVLRTAEIKEQQETIIAQKDILGEQAQKLRKSNEKLKSLDEAKSRFFANISHEFRTPLTLMITGLEEIKLWSKGQKQPIVVEVMMRNVRWLQHQVDQLLDITKMEANKMALDKQAEEAVSVFRTHSLMFESLFVKKGIDFSFHSTMQPTVALLDKSSIGKICLNLISNAYKFTPTGGSIEASLHTEKELLIFQVKDNGIGIAPDQLPYIFERFHQVDRSHEQQGTGIGLALTKELVDLHNGQITVESELGSGSLFIVSIPLILSEEQVSDTKSITSSARRYVKDTIQESKIEPTKNLEGLGEKDKPLILIVEDNADLRLMLKHIINHHYQTAFANNGEDGIREAINLIPDLIVSDVMMPRKDGFELCKTLKQHQATSHIPIILLTARVEHEDKLEGLFLGADDYLAKPFDQTELLLRIQNLIHTRMQVKKQLASSNTLVPFLPETLANNPIDQKFMENLTEVVKENYTDHLFGVANLADAMAMSKSQLTRKMKALLNCTPNKFIQNFRLQQALELLKNKQWKIVDIGFHVGFSSKAYFTKYFKEQFGKTPKSYQESLDQKQH